MKQKFWDIFCRQVFILILQTLLFFGEVSVTNVQIIIANGDFFLSVVERTELLIQLTSYLNFL